MMPDFITRQVIKVDSGLDLGQLPIYGRMIM